MFKKMSGCEHRPFILLSSLVHFHNVVLLDSFCPIPFVMDVRTLQTTDCSEYHFEERHERGVVPMALYSSDWLPTTFGAWQ